MTDTQDILGALEIAEHRHPKAAWSLGTITSDTHMASPAGAGVSVQLHAPTGERVFEKDRGSFKSAMERAADRLDRRIAGHSGA
jgi:hypothetical protein